MRLRILLAVVGIVVGVGLAMGGTAGAEMANYAIIKEEGVRVGHLVSFVDSKYQLTAQANDEMMVGVVVDSPKVALNLVGHDNSYPLMHDSEAMVLVSAAEGDIEKGDYVTSSEIRGVAVKARRSGFVVGQALESFSATTEAEDGLIWVRLLMREVDAGQFNSPVLPLTQRIADSLGFGVSSDEEGLDQASLVTRLALPAILLLVLAVIAGYLYGNTSKHSLTVLENAPLTGTDDSSNVVKNVLIMVGIILAAVVLTVVIVIT